MARSQREISAYLACESSASGGQASRVHELLALFADALDGVDVVGSLLETCAGRFSGIPVSMHLRLFSAHEDEGLVVICRMALSSKVASSGNLE